MSNTTIKEEDIPLEEHKLSKTNIPLSLRMSERLKILTELPNKTAITNGYNKFVTTKK